jgi:hypothetical protein
VEKPQVLEMERRYLETNPHEQDLRKIFRLARIDYGRIDYAMLGDRLQVWEINTNPHIIFRRNIRYWKSGKSENSEREVMMQQLVEPFIAAFTEIDVTDVRDDARPPT